MALGTFVYKLNTRIIILSDIALLVQLQLVPHDYQLANFLETKRKGRVSSFEGNYALFNIFSLYIPSHECLVDYSNYH